MEYVTLSVVGSEVVSWRRQERERVRVKNKEREGMMFSRGRERERVVCWEMGFEILRELRSFW